MDKIEVDMDWTKEQKDEITNQLECLITAIRESDQIVNPGYRQGSYYGLLEVAVRAIEENIRRWDSGGDRSHCLLGYLNAQIG